MKKFVLILGAILVTWSANAQIQISDDADWSIKERGFLGIGIGGLGFGTGPFGTYYSIGVTPQIGYMLHKNVSTGFAFDYQYTGYPDQNLKRTQYGWYPYLRFNIKRFFIQTDYDWYNIDNIYTPVKDRQIYNRFLAGVGYFTQGRGRGGANILLSYDFAYEEPSQFNSPLSIRIFFTF
jgi:hypothetical protein